MEVTDGAVVRGTGRAGHWRVERYRLGVGEATRGGGVQGRAGRAPRGTAARTPDAYREGGRHGGGRGRGRRRSSSGGFRVSANPRATRPRRFSDRQRGGG